MTPRLSAAIIAHNEERFIGGCLASLSGLADEVVVLDDGSTDATVAIARASGARVEHRPWDDFARQKQASVDLTSGEWVIILDADERVTPELAAAVRTALADSGGVTGYWVRRTITYLGKPLRWGGTGSEWILRVVRRDLARFTDHPVHPHIIVTGRTERLRGDLEHIKYDALSQHLQTINKYTDVIAQGKRDAGARFHRWHLLRIPFELVNRLIFRGGFLDGRAGVIYAVMGSYYAFLKYAKIWRAGDG